MVADTQFAALGVVLIAVLARVGRIVGLPEPKLEPQLSLDRTAGARPLLTSAFGEAGEIVPRPNGEDIGKVVQRNTDKEEEIVTNAIMRDRWREESRTMDRAVQGDADLASKRQPEVMKGKGRAAEQEGRETHPQVRQKKRRKKGNAIDDLFDDLD